MVNKYAIIRNGIVENICLWDGVLFGGGSGASSASGAGADGGRYGGGGGWTPPEGAECRKLKEGEFCDIGSAWDGVTFSRPIPSPAEASAAATSQIKAIESNQGRAVREAVIGAPGAMDRLKTLDAQIAALRSALK